MTVPSRGDVHDGETNEAAGMRLPQEGVPILEDDLPGFLSDTALNEIDRELEAAIEYKLATGRDAADDIIDMVQRAMLRRAASRSGSADR